MNDMPEFEPSSVDERINGAAAAGNPGHHSFLDWDFENVNWVLDDAIFHAAPPSLHGTAGAIALVKDSETGALSDGRLVAWARATGTGELVWFGFRNQHADGGADRQNYYWVRISAAAGGVRLYRYIAGGSTLIDTKTHTWVWAKDTWYKIRITWWSAADRLFLRTERWTGTEWVTFGGNADVDIQDVADQFKDAEVNRCGLYYHSLFYFDDVEVWG